MKRDHSVSISDFSRCEKWMGTHESTNQAQKKTEEWNSFGDDEGQDTTDNGGSAAIADSIQISMGCNHSTRV